MVDIVSTQLHASPTPAPPASIPTHLVIVGPVPHARPSGLSGLPTCGHPDYHDAVPVEIVQFSPESFARHLVTPTELTQVTDLLTFLAGVVLTTPVVST